MTTIMDTSCTTKSNSPIKMRKRGTPTRYRDNVEIIDIHEDAEMGETSMMRRRVKRSTSSISSSSSSLANKKRMCYLLWASTALLGVSTIGILATRNGIFQKATSQFVNHRRLGLKVTKPHTGQGPIRTFTISDSVRDELYRECIGIKVDTSNLEDLEEFIDRAKEIVQSHISSEMMDELKALHNSSSPTSAVYFRNLPVDPHVPPTPTDGSLSLGKTTYIAEAMLVGFGELTSAHVVGYSAETQYSNPWIHEGFPRNTAGSALTKASDLSFHQDMSYHSEVPDILGLVGVREGNDHKVDTELIDNREVFEMLPESIVAMLREPRFQIKTGDWVDAGFDVGQHGRGILLDAASLAIPVDWENMVGLDKEAEFAVTMLQRAITEAPKHYVHFIPGDLLFFNNRRTIHARTPYVDLRYDGTDRVLNRAYFRKDWTPEERKTRMI